MNSSKPKIGIRYCGGCNPKYDRGSLAKRMAALFPDADFVPAVSGESYDAVLVMHGCLSRCTKTDDINVSARQLVPMNGWDELLPSKKKLEEILKIQQMLSEGSSIELSPEEVKEILPHRAPMLFIDRVTKLVPGVECRSEFYADPGLELFKGHFPGEPVFPGALTVEAIAQCADIMVLTKSMYKGKTPLFMGIDKASFRRKIEPGQLLDIRTSVFEENEERAVVVCRGQVFVEDTLCATAQVSLALR